MSNWGYVSLAYGVTYFILIAYTVYLMRRRSAAHEALASETQRTEG